MSEINRKYLQKKYFTKIPCHLYFGFADLTPTISNISKLSHFNLGHSVYYPIISGIEADRRSKILRTFVRNTYSYHLSEILATIVNEYTDWERPVQHPINIRDETLEALSDAQYVAPVVHTADLHSAEHRNSYLYVFDYQTKFGDYPQVCSQMFPYKFVWISKLFRN